LSSFHNHCDAGDASNGHIWHAAVNGICDPSYFDGCEASTTETFLVRTGGPVDLSPVPEPATILLFGSTLASFGVTAWRRARRA
jgi:hypothetical protein